MAYKKLILRSLPRIEFAHGFQTETYHHQFQPRENLTEITLIQRGALRKQDQNGRTDLIPAPALHVNFFRDAFSVSSMDSPHSHVTVAFTGDCTVREIGETEIRRARGSEREDGSFYALLPDWMPVETKNTELERRITQIILRHMAALERRRLCETGLLLELLAEITELVYQRVRYGAAGPSDSGSFVYVERAISYITAHLEDRFSVPALAEHLGVSTGYLSRLFQEALGQSVIAYVNRLKIERVKELIRSRGATLREAGESVGIDDPNYLSRLFKKVCGMSVREFRRMDVRL